MYSTVSVHKFSLNFQNPNSSYPFQFIFTAIPLVSSIAFWPSVITPPSHVERFWSLLSIASLLTTAYTMKRSPLQPDRKGKRPLSTEDERLAWIHEAMVPTNGVVCLLLTTTYFLGRTAQPIIYLIPAGMFTFEFTFSILRLFLYALPRPNSYLAAMLSVILLARRMMLSVDLSTLKDLQYEYKGA